MSPINIVLHDPEIPQNTGNIARTSAVTGCALHLIEPLGFTVTDRSLKRAGLDYWKELDITYYRDLDDFFARNPDGKYFFFTTKAKSLSNSSDGCPPATISTPKRSSSSLSLSASKGLDSFKVIFAPREARTRMAAIPLRAAPKTSTG